MYVITLSNLRTDVNGLHMRANEMIKCSAEVPDERDIMPLSEVHGIVYFIYELVKYPSVEYDTVFSIIKLLM